MRDRPENIIALMYHRVDTTETDPWGICVSPHRFEEQIRWLKNNCHVVTVQDIFDSIRSRHIPENSVCLTFDDGYADNYLHAKPILERWNCPAAFFIATGFIGSNEMYWWDELETIFLHTRQLPKRLTLQINGREEYYTISESNLTDKLWQQHQSWKWYERAPASRCAVFLSAWQTLRNLPVNDIKMQMQIIRTWANTGDHNAQKRLPVNEQQLKELSSNPLFTMGIHTHSHLDLALTARHIQKEETEQCRQILQEQFGIDSHCISYPYGRYNEDTILVAKESGMEIGFTTEAATITVASDRLSLGRYQVGNWDAETLAQQLLEWK